MGIVICGQIVVFTPFILINQNHISATLGDMALILVSLCLPYYFSFYKMIVKFKVQGSHFMMQFSVQAYPHVKSKLLWDFNTLHNHFKRLRAKFCMDTLYGHFGQGKNLA